MSDERVRGAFTDVRPLRRNRKRLGDRAGLWRLIFIVAALLGAALWAVPVVARLALNGGRVYPTDEVHSLWGAVVDDLVLPVPAWLVIAVGLVGSVAGIVYLVLRDRVAGSDAPYVGILSVAFFGVFPWFIAMFDVDPTGIVSTPGDDGYPMGWHWLVSPAGFVVLVVAIAVSIRGRRRRTGRRA